MQNTRFRFLFVLGLMLTLGLATAFAAGGVDKKKKRKKIPKNMGAVTVRTTEEARVVKIDGQEVGISGTSEAAEFYVTPGIHFVEVIGPDGKTFSKNINVVKKARHCICLSFVTKITTRPCPYDMRVTGPASVTEGDTAIFIAKNEARVSPTAESDLNFIWTVLPAAASFTGQGTNTISVDTNGLGGQTVRVLLDTGDGTNDADCRQKNSVPMDVERIPPPLPPKEFDVFPTVANDDDKARLDNLVVELQNNPNVQGYIILYPGTDRKSQTRTPARLTEIAYNYLVQERGADPSRIRIVTTTITRPVTTYEIWLVPPGAATPVPK